MSVFNKRRAAFFADCIRHICTTAILPVIFENGIIAVWTAIMRRQRINLCNPGHIRYKRRTYRTTRPYKIAIIIGFFYEFMCNQIQHREPVTDNRIQFSCNSCLNQLRKFRTIQLMCFGIRQITDFVFCPFNFRRMKTIRNRLDFFKVCNDFFRIGDNNFFCRIRREIIKLCQHFLRIAIIQWRLLIGILKLFTRH